MSKHVLFLVHGMGVHKKGSWANSVIKKLKDSSKKYSYFRESKLEDEVKFVPISYDNIISSEVLKKWQEDASKISDFAKENGLEDNDALNWLKNAGKTEKNFLWSHVADVIIYRFFRIYRVRIQMAVVKQIADEVDRQIREFRKARCSVLAHSLGTAVVHDSLHYLGTEKWGGSTNIIYPTHWRFQSIFMIANTSRLLQTEPKAYNSIVKPGPNLDSGSYFCKYFNFRHELDPVPFPRMFDPVGWGSAYQSFVVRHYWNWDIHGFEHYLDNPRVHIPILRAITSEWAVSDQEEVAAVENYSQFGGKLKVVQKAKAFMTGLEVPKHELGEEPSISELIKGFVKFYQLVDKYK
jgi:hypothetical protein